MRKPLYLQFLFYLPQRFYWFKQKHRRNTATLPPAHSTNTVWYSLFLEILLKTLLIVPSYQRPLTGSAPELRLAQSSKTEDKNSFTALGHNFLIDNMKLLLRCIFIKDRFSLLACILQLTKLFTEVLFVKSRMVNYTCILSFWALKGV